MIAKIIYNKNLLDTIINNSNAILIGNYDKLNRDIKINFKCNCGQESIKTFRSINRIGAICVECTKQTQQEKKKNTELEIYGTDNIMSLPKFKEKIKQSYFKKYGVDHPLKNKEVINKLRKTVKIRYGVEHVLQIEKIKEKAGDTMIERYGVKHISQLDTTKNKIKEKMLDKYGVEYNLQSPIIRNQIKNTNLQKYGVEHITQSQYFRENSEKTCINKYGVKNYTQTSEFKDKFKKTCLERYGVEHPLQNTEIQEKSQKNAKKFKEYIMPSGNKIKVQGYEPFALDDLVKNYDEIDIITQRKEIPRITYNIDNKQKYYFPDIYIKSINKIIEVKSTWTYKCKEDNIQAKSDATKLAGYDYEIWIYDSKGNKTVK
jgi:hypothetical protein